MQACVLFPNPYWFSYTKQLSHYNEVETRYGTVILKKGGYNKLSKNKGLGIICIKLLFSDVKTKFKCTEEV